MNYEKLISQKINACHCTLNPALSLMVHSSVVCEHAGEGLRAGYDSLIGHLILIFRYCATAPYLYMRNLYSALIAPLLLLEFLSTRPHPLLCLRLVCLPAPF